MSDFPIFTQRIAGELMARGVKLIRTEPHRSKPNFNVFIFEDTATLRQYLDSRRNQKSN